MYNSVIVASVPISDAQLEEYNDRLSNADIYERLSQKEKEGAQRYLNNIVGPRPEIKQSFYKYVYYRTVFSEDKKSLILMREESY